MGKTTQTKKGTLTTETVLGTAAQQMTKAASEINSAISSLNELTSKAEELTLLVANKESQISELDVQYGEKARQAEVSFEINMKENAEKVINNFLATNGKVSISTDELNSLKKELADTKANTESETKKQVAQVANSLKSQYENDIRFLQSENKAVAAENASKIGVLAEKNKFLEEQVTKLYQQLDAERSASIERAKAGAVGQINVGSESRK